MSKSTNLKYYYLEQYLETEVRPYFEKEHHLTSEQFFAIIEWKNPKFGKTKLTHLKPKDIEKLFKTIYGESREKQLKILVDIKGLKLATASAILTILYPERFTVYDVRVRKQLRKRGLWEEEPDDITYCVDVVNRYFDKYLPPIEKLATDSGLSLRDCDRALWAQDWHEDLMDFIIAGSSENNTV